MKLRSAIIGATIFVSLWFSAVSHAGLMELSGSFSYSSSNMGPGGYSWTRRYAVALGYYFWELSEIEVSVQDIMYRTVISTVEDTTFHDKIYSVEWVQSLTTRKAAFQPYFKLGIGQLMREATGTYMGEESPPSTYDSFTVLVGAGLRIFILDILALRAEGTSYLVGGVLSTWKDNFAVSGGVSVYF